MKKAILVGTVAALALAAPASAGATPTLMKGEAKKEARDYVSKTGVMRQLSCYRYTRITFHCAVVDFRWGWSCVYGLDVHANGRRVNGLVSAPERTECFSPGV